jgi:hypothetical protein
MAGLTLATWNINSVRLRHPHIARWADEAQPDVICLQEIKCQPDQFPTQRNLRSMGYPHVHVRGQKGMHGVAIASRLPIEELDDHALCPKRRSALPAREDRRDRGPEFLHPRRRRRAGPGDQSALQAQAGFPGCAGRPTPASGLARRMPTSCWWATSTSLRVNTMCGRTSSF